MLRCKKSFTHRFGASLAFDAHICMVFLTACMYMACRDCGMKAIAMALPYIGEIRLFGYLPIYRKHIYILFTSPISTQNRNILKRKDFVIFKYHAR